MLVEFRDGEKEIPDHLAALMQGIDTYRLTVEEAIQEANKQAMARHLNEVQDHIIADHMASLERPR